MAERRYGFRFSFAEGCIIVASLLGASFLVFLFGVYAGRELEARKTAENTRIVRMSSNVGGEKVSETRPNAAETTVAMVEKEKPSTPPLLTQDTSKMVVVIAPQKPSEPPVATPPAIVKQETSPQADLVKKALTNPAPVIKEEKPQLSAAHISPEKKLAPKTTPAPASPLKSLQPTSGRWSIQVHATRNEESAQQLARQLRSQGHTPVVSKIIRDGEVWYRVRVGSFANAEEARTSGERLRREGEFSQAYPVSN